MNTQELREYFEDNGTVLNQFSVEFDSDLEYVCICSLFPPYKEKYKAMSMELTCFCETMIDFINLFNISSLDDIELITPEFLNSLYEAGDAELACYPNTYRSQLIYFRKQGKSLFVRTEDFVQHKVETELSTSDDFIVYSKNYLYSLRYANKTFNS